MRGPKADSNISDRHLECQEAMEIAFNSLIDLAIDAGWTELEACVALQELADSRVISSQANSATDAQIRRALAKRSRRG